MKYRIKTSEVVDKGYQRYLKMVDDLKVLSPEERESIYEKYQWLFSSGDFITLESLLVKPRPSSSEKFRLWFYLIGNSVLTGFFAGCWNYEMFLDAYPKPGMNSYEFPHKVLLAFAMMGYITGLKEDYSNAGHGRIYHIDLCRIMGFQSTVDDLLYGDPDDFKGWSAKRDMVVEFDIENTTWYAYPEWSSRRQMKAISSLSLVPEAEEYARGVLKDYQGINIYNLPKGERAIPVNAYMLHLSYDNLKAGAIGNFKVDDYGGRCYTLPTGMEATSRLKYLRLDNEKVAEVDVGSAQPFFLGARLYRQTGRMSQWLKHCLAGDFYEWIMEITQMRDWAKIPDDLSWHDVKKVVKGSYVLPYIYSLKEDHDKRWYKYGCGLFTARLESWLKKNDKEVYDFIQKYKNAPVKKSKVRRRDGLEGKEYRSDLSKEMQREEVEYIQQCLASMPDILCYNIHDCVSCKVSDAERVREVMLQVGRQRYGLEMRINIETEESEVGTTPS